MFLQNLSLGVILMLKKRGCYDFSNANLLSHVGLLKGPFIQNGWMVFMEKGATVELVNPWALRFLPLYPDVTTGCVGGCDANLNQTLGLRPMTTTTTTTTTLPPSGTTSHTAPAAAAVEPAPWRNQRQAAPVARVSAPVARVPPQPPRVPPPRPNLGADPQDSSIVCSCNEQAILLTVSRSFFFRFEPNRTLTFIRRYLHGTPFPVLKKVFSVEAIVDQVLSLEFLVRNYFDRYFPGLPCSVWCIFLLAQYLHCSRVVTGSHRFEPHSPNIDLLLIVIFL